MYIPKIDDGLPDPYRRKLAFGMNELLAPVVIQFRVPVFEICVWVFVRERTSYDALGMLQFEASFHID